MKKILLLLVSVSMAGTALAKSTGGAPAVPCYVEGKKVSSSMSISECLREGGHYNPKLSYKQKKEKKGKKEESK